MACTILLVTLFDEVKKRENAMSSYVYYRRTNAGLAKEPARLGGRRRRRRALDLRGGWGARLAHRVCSVHIERSRLWWFVNGRRTDLEGVKCIVVEIFLLLPDARRLLFVRAHLQR